MRIDNVSTTIPLTKKYGLLLRRSRKSNVLRILGSKSFIRRSRCERI
uniref:ORF46k n=1 Tax=Pinus koraiensis TaxID=88728 RepID=A4QMH0_PINKO|nr:ORF46k [Pinus koraiensis]